jgi:hypothetical protein
MCGELWYSCESHLEKWLDLQIAQHIQDSRDICLYGPTVLLSSSREIADISLEDFRSV